MASFPEFAGKHQILEGWRYAAPLAIATAGSCSTSLRRDSSCPWASGPPRAPLWKARCAEGAVPDGPEPLPSTRRVRGDRGRTALPRGRPGGRQEPGNHVSLELASTGALVAYAEGQLYRPARARSGAPPARLTTRGRDRKGLGFERLQAAGCRLQALFRPRAQEVRSLKPVACSLGSTRPSAAPLRDPHAPRAWLADTWPPRLLPPGQPRPPRTWARPSGPPRRAAPTSAA